MNFLSKTQTFLNSNFNLTAIYDAIFATGYFLNIKHDFSHYSTINLLHVSCNQQFVSQYIPQDFDCLVFHPNRSKSIFFAVKSALKPISCPIPKFYNFFLLCLTGSLSVPPKLFSSSSYASP